MEKRPSIRTQVTLILLTTTLLTLFIIASVFLLLTAGYSRSLGRSYVEGAASELRETLVQQSSIQNLHPDEIRTLIRRQNLPSDIVVRLVNERGQVIFTNDSVLSDQQPTPDSHLSQWIMNSLESNQRMREMRRPPGIPQQAPIMHMGPRGFINPRMYQMSFVTNDGGYILQIDTPKTLVQEVTLMTAQGLAIAGFISLIIAGILSFFVARIFSKPVQNLNQLVCSTKPEVLAMDPEVFSPENTGTLPVASSEITNLQTSFYFLGKELSTLYQKLHQEKESLKSFLADTSHELRTPLMAAGTFLELAQKNTSDNGQSNEHLLDMERQLHRMNSLVQGLLQLSRIEADVLSLDFQPLNPVNQLKTLVKDVCAAYSTTPFHLTWNKNQQDEQFQIKTDHRAFSTIFQNLIENSFQHGTDKSNSNNPILRLDIEWNRRNEILEISIRDSGPGVSPEELKKLGTRFFRGEISYENHSNTGQGLGLGLATAQSLVQALGGTLTFSSEQGFSVVVRLPV